MEQYVIVGSEGCDEYVHPPILVVVTDSNTHAGEFFAIGGIGSTNRYADLLERSVALVPVVVVRVRIVPDKQVWPAIVVEVLPDCLKAEIQILIEDTSDLRDIGECAVAVVAIETVRSAF